MLRWNLLSSWAASSFLLFTCQHGCSQHYNTTILQHHRYSRRSSRQIGESLPHSCWERAWYHDDLEVADWACHIIWPWSTSRFWYCSKTFLLLQLQYVIIYLTDQKHRLRSSDLISYDLEVKLATTIQNILVSFIISIPSAHTVHIMMVSMYQYKNSPDQAAKTKYSLLNFVFPIWHSIKASSWQDLQITKLVSNCFRS